MNECIYSYTYRDGNPTNLHFYIKLSELKLVQLICKRLKPE